MGIEVGIHLPEPHPEQLGAKLLRRTAPQRDRSRSQSFMRISMQAIPKPNYRVTLPLPHDKQLQFMRSSAKRKVVRAGRRGC
jgi:hypothetical protein